MSALTEFSISLMVATNEFPNDPKWPLWSLPRVSLGRSVFQTLVHMLGTSAADVQVFPNAHNERNLAKYQGRIDIDEKLSCRSHSLYEGVGSCDCQARSAGR
jgi:hypothetical protein